MGWGLGEGCTKGLQTWNPARLGWCEKKGIKGTVLTFKIFKHNFINAKTIIFNRKNRILRKNTTSPLKLIHVYDSVLGSYLNIL